MGVYLVAECDLAQDLDQGIALRIFLKLRPANSEVYG